MLPRTGTQNSPGEGADKHQSHLHKSGSEQLDPATIFCCAILANHEKGDTVVDQLQDTEAVSTLLCVQRFEMSLQFVDQLARIGSAGSSRVIRTTPTAVVY